MTQGLRDAFLKVNPDSAALLNMFNKDVARMVAFKDWSDEDLKSIKAPALIINADKDVILPEHALKMSQLIPNARLIILPGVHGECIGEIETASLNSKQPEMVVELVKEFLDK
jgi:pimeloyl-ACP methyl ester carboxylesterase